MGVNSSKDERIIQNQDSRYRGRSPSLQTKASQYCNNLTTNKMEKLDTTLSEFATHSASIESNDAVTKTASRESTSSLITKQNGRKLEEQIQFYEGLVAKRSEESADLQHQLELSRVKIKELESRSKESCVHCEELPNLQMKLNRYKEKYCKLKDEYNHLGQHYKEVEAVNETLHGDMIKLQKGAKSDKEKMKSTIADLNRETKEQEKIIKKAQEDIYQAKVTTAWTTEPDSTINGQLCTLERSIKNFCKLYSIKTQDDMPLHQRLPNDDDRLKEVLTHGGLQALENMRAKKNAPELLLSAWLTNYVYHHIVAYPLFFVAELESAAFPAQDPCIAVGLQRFLNMLEHCGKEKAEAINTLRSDVVRLLHTRGDKSHTDLRADFSSGVKSAEETMCGYYAGCFLNQASLLFERLDHKQVHQELQRIMISAADLSGKLNAQRSRLEVRIYNSLPHSFESSSLDMEAHSAHFAELEDDENCLNGRPVLLIMHPEVAAIGSSDGADTTTVRILKKAVVWMGKT